jgi:hypothetical protein
VIHSHTLTRRCVTRALVGVCVWGGGVCSPPVPLSDAVTVDGIAAPMELTTTSHSAPSKFTMWAGAGELWFWGKHCTGQGTTQFVLDGTASAVARPAFQVVRAHRQLPPTLLTLDFDLLSCMTVDTWTLCHVKQRACELKAVGASATALSTPSLGPL